MDSEFDFGGDVVDRRIEDCNEVLSLGVKRKNGNSSVEMLKMIWFLTVM